MKNKTKPNKRCGHQSRAKRWQRRTCKKGGMRRAMTTMGKVASEVFGKDAPNKADKAWQVAQKVKEGLTPKNLKKVNHDESPVSFASLLSPVRTSAIETRIPHSYDQIALNEAMHNTPIRARNTSENDMPPKLPSRSKHADTADTPDAWVWATTSQQPNQVVTKLFDD